MTAFLSLKLVTWALTAQLSATAAQELDDDIRGPGAPPSTIPETATKGSAAGEALLRSSLIDQVVSGSGLLAALDRQTSGEPASTSKEPTPAPSFRLRTQVPARNVITKSVLEELTEGRPEAPLASLFSEEAIGSSRWSGHVAVPRDLLPSEQTRKVILGLEAGVGPRLSERSFLWFGYRALAVKDDVQQPGFTAPVFEEVDHGPAVGFTLQF